MSPFDAYAAARLGQAWAGFERCYRLPGETAVEALEAGPGAAVAERCGERGPVQGARAESERFGRRVLAGEVGVEHDRVVGRDRATDARLDQARQGVLGE